MQAEDVNSLLKIDNISRLTDKMRALHLDTVGTCVVDGCWLRVTARNRG